MAAFVDMTVEGGDELLRKLGVMAESTPAISRAAVGAGLSVLAKACHAAAPGSIRRECGWFIRQEGDRVWGRAGLMRFPREGDGQTGPHGVYLTIGTKYIVARKFIENALNGARGSAISAARGAAKRKIEKLAADA